MPVGKQIPHDIEAKRIIAFPVEFVGHLTVEGHLLAEGVQEGGKDSAVEMVFVHDGRVGNGLQQHGFRFVGYEVVDPFSRRAAADFPPDHDRVAGNGKGRKRDGSESFVGDGSESLVAAGGSEGFVLANDVAVVAAGGTRGTDPVRWTPVSRRTLIPRRRVFGGFGGTGTTSTSIYLPSRRHRALAPSVSGRFEPDSNIT